jgi:SAM-dependent methyltransferase
MRFLDAGCNASLASYRLDTWPSLYYGVDISPRLIHAMKEFATREHITVGGFWVTDIANLPFEDNFFDIAAVIGVFEYCTLSYTELALRELHRVFKPHGRAVLDFPNLVHPHIEIMLRLEEYLGRPNIPNSRPAFEQLLTLLFSLERIDGSRVMLKYFIRRFR